MNAQRAGDIGVIWQLSASRPREWVKRVMTLLDTAIGELDSEEHPAKCMVLRAASLLREQIDPQAGAAADQGGGLLAWQARKVREYVDGHIAGPIRVAELCALIQRSEAHFSRSFKRTFGCSPHAFVIQRRLELAAQYMLETGTCLSDIALRCGFTDQAHLCKHFRHATGQTPGAWRRAHRSHHDENGAPPLERFATASRNGAPVPTAQAADAAIRVLLPASQPARARTGLTQSRAFSPKPLLRTGF
jgi:AraC family transcriptional regulator